MTTEQNTNSVNESLTGAANPPQVIEDNTDVVLIIGDVGVESFHSGKLYWVGVGGTALNLADMLCDQQTVQTFLITRTDPVQGWMTMAGLNRFADMHKDLGSVRAYQMTSAKNLHKVNNEYTDLDISGYLAVAAGEDIKFETYTGRDIDLVEQEASLKSAIDRALVTVVDTRLSKETLEVIVKSCHDMSRALVIMSNGRQTSKAKFAAIGASGGCDMLVLNPKDALLFRTEDPCSIVRSTLAAYVVPEDGSWSIHKKGREELAKGEVRFNTGEDFVDTFGVLEGFTGGYIITRFFDELSMSVEETVVAR